MSKGSGRRPGTMPAGAWETIFSKPAKCPVCHENVTRCVCNATEDGPKDGDYLYPSDIDSDIKHETGAITTAVSAMADALIDCPLKDSLKVYAAIELAFKYGERRYVEEVFRELTLAMGGPDE